MSLVSIGAPPHTASTVLQSNPQAVPASAESTAIEFAAFFRAEFQAVTRIAYLVLHDRDAAEDAAQDAFTQLHLNWGKVSAYDLPAAWVRRVAIRLAVRSLRRRRLLDTLLGRLEPPPPDHPPADPDLASAIVRLPPRQRAAIALYYYEDRPVTEVAAILNCSVNTAKAHLFKARKRLADLLSADPAEVPDVL